MENLLLDINKINYVHNVQNLSLRQIAKLYGTSHGVISKHLRTQGFNVRQRVHSIKESYFEELNNKEKFYWIGLFYADGYIRVDTTTKTHMLRLKLQMKDQDILYQLKEHLETSAPIKIEENKEGRKYAYLQVFSKKLICDLISFGVEPNKTHKLKFPEHIFSNNEDFMRSFILGVFDGDGSISTNKSNKKPIFSITGTYELLKGIQNVLINCVGLRNNKIQSHKNSFVLMYQGVRNSKKIYDWLYKGQTFFLQRKFDKFNEILTTPKYPKNYILFCCPQCDKKFYHEKRLVNQLKKYTFTARFCSSSCSGKFNRQFQLNNNNLTESMQNKLNKNIVSYHVYYNYVGVKN